MNFNEFCEAFSDLAYDFMLRAIAFDPSEFGAFSVSEGEVVFTPFTDVTLPPDLIPEISVAKNGRSRLKFYDKTELIRLAKSLGVFDAQRETEVEDFPMEDEEDEERPDEDN